MKLLLMGVGLSISMMISGCGLYKVLHGTGVSSNLPNVNVAGGIKQTGQLRSYDENANVILDDSLRDDGYYRAGVPLHFVKDSSTKVIYDKITGLEWENTPHVQSTSLSQKEAFYYCASLDLNGKNDWRLPSMRQLQDFLSQVDEKTAKGNVKKEYCSDTINSDNYPVFVSESGSLRQSSFNNPESYCHAICNRGESVAENTFHTEDNALVLEEAGLWLENSSKLLRTWKWREAIDHCEKLQLDGYDDWRLPNIHELLYYHYTAKANPEASARDNAEGYWSSTSDLIHVSGPYAQAGNFAYVESDGTKYGLEKMVPDATRKDGYKPAVRCVRGGQMHIRTKETK
jgi:small nuclear ribonucleoprotein (snRNP)-like protein